MLLYWCGVEEAPVQVAVSCGDGAGGGSVLTSEGSETEAAAERAAEIGAAERTRGRNVEVAGRAVAGAAEVDGFGRPGGSYGGIVGAEAPPSGGAGD